MCDCPDTNGRSTSRRTKNTEAEIGAVVRPAVPLARGIDLDSHPEPGDAEPADTDLAAPSVSLSPLRPCRLDFREGCYQIMHRPTGSAIALEGTLRVDRSAPDGGADRIIVSGDFYKRLLISVVGPTPVGAVADAEEVSSSSFAAAASSVEPTAMLLPIVKPTIPIHARARYHSYLRVTKVSSPIFVLPGRPCALTLTVEQYNYTQPPTGQHKGTFPAAPSRTVTMRLQPVPAPFPFSLTGGPYFEGRLFDGTVDKGRVTLAWVSPFFRRAVLEIDTLAGAVPPAPVPDGAGGQEYFDTIFAKIGWKLSVIRDQTNVPVPAGVNPTQCWTDAALHNLMSSVRKASTNLDKEWRVHMIVVPAKLGCSRGVMYDQIGVPREGCASFSDDGYPTSHSANFGTAANKKQRDVPRAYLRSAAHELTHTLNQIHQEQETTADNSIMTTTPSVADVLAGPTTGAPGVFPDQINLAQNTNVRHHLNHMPDPVIRPGGWPFGSWFPTGAPQATDRHTFAASELELEVRCTTERIVLGQPVDLEWTMTNRSEVPLCAPNDVSIEALFANIVVTNVEGHDQTVRPFVIVCDNAKLSALEPGDSVSATTRLFWSSAGFAFERPGRYTVTVYVQWAARGLPVDVHGSVEVFVDFPMTDAENRAAGVMMHPEVGKYIALGGHAYHLEEATRRLSTLAGAGGADGRARQLQGIADILPNRARSAKAPAARGGTRTAARPKPRRPAKRRKR